jgi:hypothetical protein
VSVPGKSEVFSSKNIYPKIKRRFYQKLLLRFLSNFCIFLNITAYEHSGIRTRGPNVSFLESGFSCKDRFHAGRYSKTNNDISSNYGFCFQGNLVKVNRNEKIMCHVFVIVVIVCFILGARIQVVKPDIPTSYGGPD